MTITDPDLKGSLQVLRRAGRVARRRSIALGTPFYIWKDGRVVDLNRAQRKVKKR